LIGWLLGEGPKLLPQWLARMTLLLLLLAVWVSRSLRTKTLRENMGQCKSEGQDFKRD
jgi:hypothetical protein